MYIILLLTFIVSFLLTGFVGLRIRQIKEGDPDSLSHDAILNNLSSFGHGKWKGVCHGFTLNWALAVATNKERLFYRQLHLLREHQTDLPVIVERVQAKKKNNQLLSKDEQVIETLPGLFKKMCLAQAPSKYTNKYGKLVWQTDISTILYRINAKSSGVRQVFYKTHTFASKRDAVTYFNLLKNMRIHSRVAVLISTEDHSMGFKRCGNLWRFIDINDLFEQKNTKPYFEFTSKELVDELYDKCTEPLMRRLTVNTAFIAVKSGGSLFKSLYNAFPIFPVRTKMAYSEQVSFFAMAASQGDVPTVMKCLQAGWSIYFHSQIDDKSPVLNALYEGRREVLRAMLMSYPHLINKRRKSDGFTILHIACEYGSSGIVEDLLNSTGVCINSKDKLGRTPLMMACTSTISSDQRRLLQLLLARGASLTIKDNAGFDALTHARKNNNEFAVKIIKATLQTQIIPLGHARPVINSPKYSSSRTTFFSKISTQRSPDEFDYKSLSMAGAT